MFARLLKPPAPTLPQARELDEASARLAAATAEVEAEAARVEARDAAGTAQLALQQAALEEERGQLQRAWEERDALLQVRERGGPGHATSLACTSTPGPVGTRQVYCQARLIPHT